MSDRDVDVQLHEAFDRFARATVRHVRPPGVAQARLAARRRASQARHRDGVDGCVDPGTGRRAHRPCPGGRPTFTNGKVGKLSIVRVAHADVDQDGPAEVIAEIYCASAETGPAQVVALTRTGSTYTTLGRVIASRYGADIQGFSGRAGSSNGWIRRIHGSGSQRYRRVGQAAGRPGRRPPTTGQAKDGHPVPMTALAGPDYLRWVPGPAHFAGRPRYPNRRM